MSRELLQQALDALIQPHPHIRTSFTDAKKYREKIDQAIAALKAELAKPEQEPVAVWELTEDGWDTIANAAWMETLPVGTKLYTAPPRKEWVGLTNEDWENTPDTSKQGCERDAELFDWIEQTLKDKNEPNC